MVAISGRIGSSTDPLGDRSWYSPSGASSWASILCLREAKRADMLAPLRCPTLADASLRRDAVSGFEFGARKLCAGRTAPSHPGRSETSSLGRLVASAPRIMKSSAAHTTRLPPRRGRFERVAMARRAAKATSAAAPRSSSKRPAPENPSRQSKRARAAAKKSYVEPDSDEDAEKPESPSASSLGEANESDYGAESNKDPSSESGHEEQSSDQDSQSETESARRRPAKRTVLPSREKRHDEKELWKPGAKLELGTKVIIKKPKAREAGDTPYADETIHPNTLLFLQDLAANNDRQWLKGKICLPSVDGPGSAPSPFMA